MSDRLPSEVRPGDEEATPFVQRLLVRARERPTQLRLAGRIVGPALPCSVVVGALGGAGQVVLAALVLAPPLLAVALVEVALREHEGETPLRTGFGVWAAGTLSGLVAAAQAIYLRDLYTVGPSAPLRTFQELHAHGAWGLVLGPCLLASAFASGILALAAVLRARAPLARRVRDYLIVGFVISAAVMAVASQTFDRSGGLRVPLILATLSGLHAAWLWVVDSAAARAEGAAPAQRARRGLRTSGADDEDDEE